MILNCTDDKSVCCQAVIKIKWPIIGRFFLFSMFRILQLFVIIRHICFPSLYGMFYVFDINE